MAETVPTKTPLRCAICVALVALALILAAPLARADPGASAWFTTDQGQVRLVAAQAFVGDDAAIELGLEFRLAPHWKIYWRSPGDAGYPPHLDWAGSTNLAAAVVAWPAPQRFSVLGLETVGYEGTIVLPIHARAARAGQPLQAHLALDYLTCKEICIPYKTTLSLDLPAAAGTAGGGFGPLIARFAAQVPGDGRDSGLALAGAVVRAGTPGTLDITVRSDRPLARPDAFVEGADGVTFGAPQPLAATAPDETLLRLKALGPKAAVAGLVGKPLVVTLVDGARAMEATVVPAQGAPALALAALWPMLAVALLGGLILNVMPCVLPVLSLKLVGALEHAERPLRVVRIGFLATAAGILLSFLALALAMAALTRAGVAVGWGMQFQEPFFLATMVALLTLFAANLWGLYEVALPPALSDLAGRAALGNVATGAFATLLATPCSAPFLGTALGFALASGPVEIIAIFLALGIGFAAPYLVVAAAPRLIRLLPRPGRWMVALKRVLGVALGATALWLLGVMAAERGWGAALLLGALMVGLTASLAWLSAGAIRRGAAACLVVAALAVPAVTTAPPASAIGAAGLWRPFDPAALGPLVHDGRVVFVDVTAEWCLTCKVNERFVLDSAAVRERLAAPGVIAMRADWTRPDAAIAAYLRRFGRYGIPFNAVYGPGAPAGVALPEILTTDAVRAALRQAAGGRADGRG
jgi:suppressor for copper-sensitivity B